MRHGVTLQGVDDPATFGELAAWIEELGYDHLWITDSSLHAGDVYVYAVLALRATSRLVVGTAVTNPLTRHTAITANAMATLERLAPGRVICGIGVGDRPLGELGLRPAKVDTLAGEIAVLRRLWQGETLDGPAGRRRYARARLRDAVGEIPVHVSASGPRTLEMAGEHADGVILLAGWFPEALAFAREHMQAGIARSTRPACPTTCFLYGAIDDDPAVAVETARSIAAWFPQTAPVYARMAGMSEELIAAVKAAYGGGEFQEAAAAARLIPDEIVRRIALAGTREDAAQRIGWLREEGVEAVSVFPLGPRRMDTIRAFAEVALAGAGAA